MGLNLYIVDINYLLVNFLFMVTTISWKLNTSYMGNWDKNKKVENALRLSKILRIFKSSAVITLVHEDKGS